MAIYVLSSVELVAFQVPEDEGRSLYVSGLPTHMGTGEMEVSCMYGKRQKTALTFSDYTEISSPGIEESLYSGIRSFARSCLCGRVD